MYRNFGRSSCSLHSYVGYLRCEACFDPVAISRKKTDLLYGCVFASGRIEMAENQNKTSFSLVCSGL